MCWPRKGGASPHVGGVADGRAGRARRAGLAQARHGSGGLPAATPANGPYHAPRPMSRAGEEPQPRQADGEEERHRSGSRVEARNPKDERPPAEAREVGPVSGPVEVRPARRHISFRIGVCGSAPACAGIKKGIDTGTGISASL